MYRLKPNLFPWKIRHITIAIAAVISVYLIQYEFFSGAIYSSFDFLRLITIQAMAFLLPVFLFLHIGQKRNTPEEHLYNPIKLWFSPGSLPRDILVGLVLGMILALLSGYSIKQVPTKTLLELKAPLARAVANCHSKSEIWNYILSIGIIAPIAEEIFFRGFLYAAFRKKLGFLPAMILSSLLFMVAHIGSIKTPAFVVGLIAATLFEFTGSLVPAIFAHIGINMGFVIFLTNYGFLAKKAPSWGFFTGLIFLNILLFALGYPLFAPGGTKNQRQS